MTKTRNGHPISCVISVRKFFAIRQKENGRDCLFNFYLFILSLYYKTNSHSHNMFFFFWPFPLIRNSHTILSFSKPSCLQCPSPSHQLSPYLLLQHLKIFSLVSLFFSFPVIHFHHLSSYIFLVSPHDMSIPPQPALPHLHS